MNMFWRPGQFIELDSNATRVAVQCIANRMFRVLSAFQELNRLRRDQSQHSASACSQCNESLGFLPNANVSIAVNYERFENVL